MVPTETDVVIVGAGPVGLMLAGDLAAAGVHTTVLERRVEQSNLTRAFGVHARTLEQLDARGLADELITTGAPIRRLRLFDRFDIDLGVIPSRFAYLLITPQYNVESLLRRRAQRAGAVLIRGAEVLGLHQDSEGVHVETAGGEAIRASYAVGADGARSRVREALGLPFPGSPIITSIMLADVRLAQPPEDVLSANATGDCFAFVAPFGDGWYRVFAWDRRNPRPDDAPLDFAEVRDVTRRALGIDFGMHDPRWMSRFHSDERQVPRYRSGRVFLAGDAAHVHSPAGGLGMNTGLQDAANLGWKLAEVLRGRATEDLLDSYHAERHPVGRAVLRTSGALIRLAMIKSRIERAARNGLGGTALRIGPVARKAAGSVSGVSIRYPAPRGAHPLTGCRAPDALLAGDGQSPGRLYEALRGGTFVLLAPAEAVPAARNWGPRVRAASPADPGGPTTLVRPDGYVAWATDRTRASGLDGEIRDALRVHCGTVDRQSTPSAV
ncbi:FAD-dependent monooxygenase [Rugosimonospora acidiphila]|uniref:FAD-dependent monooxygenase n=1 Tax=Rugosimonospora acidiphila TaxID=556531 RepID=A0ABP9ST27_9ACTN